MRRRGSLFYVQKVNVGVGVGVGVGVRRRRKNMVYALVGGLHDFGPFVDVEIGSYDVTLCTRTRIDRFALVIKLFGRTKRDSLARWEEGARSS